MKTTRHLVAFALVARGLLAATQAHAQYTPDEPDETTEPDRIEAPPKPALDATELAKRAQNPVSTGVANVPIEQHFDLGTGPESRGQSVTRFEPTVPLKAGDDWFIVTRMLVPVVDRPVPGGRAVGVGDFALALYATPALHGKVTWGAGPAGVFPTATEPEIGFGKWSTGPSVVMLGNAGPIVAGALATQLWSYAGKNAAPDVSLLAVEPFVHYNLPHGWAIATTPRMLHDWKRGADGWTVPLGADVAKTFVIAKAGFRAFAGMYWNAVRPDDGPEAQVRLHLAMLLPQ